MSENIRITCDECKVEYGLPVTKAEYEAWLESGALIQRVFPNLSVDDRELMISGMCGKCFDALFEGVK